MSDLTTDDLRKILLDHGHRIIEALKKESSLDVIHYGPVWNKPNRKDGGTLAACDTDHDDYACLTTHKPSVTCPICKQILQEQTK